MIQPALAPENGFDGLLTRIVTEIDPRRVFLFGSRARGDARPDSDYDLIVEVDDASREGRRKLSMICEGSTLQIDVHVRAIGQIERRMDDPGTMDWDVVREGKLLYTRPGVRPRGWIVRERPAGPPKSVKEWWRIASHDLYHARHHLDDDLEDWSDEICFLCQQAGEKALKALIVAQSVRPAHTHKLMDLLSRARELRIALDGIDAECVLLSKYVIEPRYPPRQTITRKHARAAVEAADKILRSIAPSIP